jgi:hypothetical protein
MKKTAKNQLIKIAYENPELRPEILNMVKKASLTDLYHFWADAGGLEASVITTLSVAVPALLNFLMSPSGKVLSKGEEIKGTSVEVPKDMKPGEAPKMSKEDIAEIKENFKEIALGVPKFGEALKEVIKSNPHIEQLSGWDEVHTAKFTADLKGLLKLVGVLKKIRADKKSESEELIKKLNLSEVRGFANCINDITAVLEKHTEHAQELMTD